MRTINVGEFEAVITDPYPVWVELRYRGERLCSFSHCEVEDLKYLARQSVNACRLALKLKNDDPM